jgi:GcrA cell cycle regulator
MDSIHIETRSSLGLPPFSIVPTTQPKTTTQERRSGWSEELVGELVALYNKGYSAGAISKAIPGNFSRNAVIGKIHRMGLPALGDTVKVRKQRDSQLSKVRARQRRAAERLERAKHIYPTPPSIAEAPLPVNEPYAHSLNLSFDQITKYSCRWIDGDPRDGAGFCGHEQVAGSAYCPHHYGLTVQPFRPKGSIPKEQRLPPRHHGNQRSG